MCVLEFYLLWKIINVSRTKNVNICFTIFKYRTLFTASVTYYFSATAASHSNVTAVRLSVAVGSGKLRMNRQRRRRMRHGGKKRETGERERRGEHSLRILM